MNLAESLRQKQESLANEGFAKLKQEFLEKYNKVTPSQKSITLDVLSVDSNSLTVFQEWLHSEGFTTEFAGRQCELDLNITW